MPDLLFVCEGNVSRSVLAERVLAALVARTDYPHIQVASAGTRAAAGPGIDPLTAPLITALGGDPWDHQPRQLRAEHVVEAGLVLTATRGQRSAVVRLYPPAVQYTYTIRQFGRVLQGAGDDVADLKVSDRSAEEQLDTLNLLYRSAMDRVDNHAGPDDDVADPAGKGKAAHRAAARTIVPTLSVIAAALDLPPLPADGVRQIGVDTAPEPRGQSRRWRRRD